jgi:transcription initiation factor IIE alpha subunit
MGHGNLKKIWYSPVVSRLKKEWNSEMSWDEVILMCGKLTKTRNSYRKRNNIPNEMYRCPKCKSEHEVKLELITVGSALYALMNECVISYDEYEDRHKSWTKYQRKHRLKANGQPK